MLDMAAGSSSTSVPDPMDAIVDTDRIPVHAPASPGYADAVADVRAALGRDGCAVIRGFLRPEAIAQIRRQAQAVLGQAHVNDIESNPYSTRRDPSLPPEHPINTFMERTNAFVPAASIPDADVVKTLYRASAFQRFVADCLHRSQIHEYADPFAALVLNLLRPGTQHPWHYDTNEFIVSTLVQPGESGGTFEYCPKIRAPGQENYDRVGRVLRDEDRREVRQLDLQPGDLQLFLGRFSLHRVTRVGGPRPRITAIFAYAQTPGMVGKVERTRQLFGRVAPEHLAAPQNQRTDGLVD